MVCLRRSLILLFTLALSLSPALASSNRLAALGGEARFLLDTSNLSIYPATALEFPHLGIELFDDWGGIAYPLTAGQTLGIFFNRPTAQLTRLNAYVRQTESPLFKDLEPQPWIDLLYGCKLRPTTRIGISGRIAYDTLTRIDDRASAFSADLRLGLRLGSASGSLLDATIGLTHQRFEEASSSIAPPIRHQTDGNGYLLALRGRLPLSPTLTLLSSIDLEQESFALSPAHRDFHAAHLTLGVNAAPTRNLLLIAGLVVDGQQTEIRNPDERAQEETVFVLPGTVVAGEVQVGSMLFRLGMRHENRLASQKRLRAGQYVKTRISDSSLQTELGIGLEFGPLHLDGLLEKNFLRDGPQFLGGSPHGGGIFTRLSLIYHFSR